MHFNIAVVCNEAQPSELVQKSLDSRSRSADHLGERVLVDLLNGPVRLTVFPMAASTRVSAPAASRPN